METNTDGWALTAAKISIGVMVLVVIVVVVLDRQIAANGAQAFTNTNLAAPFSALGFLAGTGVFFVGLLVVVGAAISGHRRVARATALVAAVELLLYGALLFGYSSRSKDVLLNAGQEKFFCEIDCHIGYTITDVARAGDSVRVSLRTHFDEHTIAPWRGDAPVTPSPRVIELLDASGRIYPAHQSGGPKLTTPLRPGETYVSEFTFTLPPEARDPRLLVATDAKFPERVLIGNENSFRHGKAYFRVPAISKS